MKNRLFSILTVPFVVFTFLSCSLIRDPQVGDLPDGSKAQHRMGFINNIQYSPDGTKLTVASSSGIWHYDAQTGKKLGVFTPYSTYRAGFIPMNVAFSPDGKTLASGCRDGTIRLWDTDTSIPRHTLSGHKRAVWSVAYSPDGKTVASGGQDKTLRLWDANTGQHLRKLKGHKGWVLSVTYSPDGRTIATGSEDATLRLWDANTGQHLRTFKWDKGHIRSVAFSPDGRTIASATRNNTITTICLWDVNSGRQIQTLSGYTRIMNHKDSNISARRGFEPNIVAFSPDGKTIVSASFGETHQWDANTGQHLRKLEGQQDLWWVFNVVFSPDGKTIASANIMEVNLWDANTGKYLRTLIKVRPYTNKN